MKQLDAVKEYLPGESITDAVIKIETVGTTLDGGFHVDLTLTNGTIIEAAVAPEKLKLLEERLLEEVFFVVKPIEQNRYECTVMIFGKAPEYKH